MKKDEFMSYMNYQINFLKNAGLWDEAWLNKNSHTIGALLCSLYKEKNPQHN